MKTELLGAELKKAEAADLQRLELNDNMVLSIRRLRYVDGIPLTIEEMRFSREYLYLLMEDLTGSIHSLLQEHGVKLKAAQKSFAICNATKEEAELLNVERGSALLFMKNMFYDQNKKPVFFSKDVFNADYFELKFTLQDMIKYEEVRQMVNLKRSQVAIMNIQYKFFPLTKFLDDAVKIRFRRLNYGERHHISIRKI